MASVDDIKYLDGHEVCVFLLLLRRGDIFILYYITLKQIPKLYNSLLKDLLKAKPIDANLWMLTWFQNRIPVQ